MYVNHVRATASIEGGVRRVCHGWLMGSDEEIAGALSTGDHDMTFAAWPAG